MRWILSLVLVLALCMGATASDKTCSNGSCGSTISVSTNSKVVNGCTQTRGHHRCHGHRHHR